APRSSWMLTRATFTIVMSSNRMNTPRQTATSVHHLASLPGVGVSGSGAPPLWVLSVVVVGSVLSFHLPAIPQRPNRQSPNDYPVYDTHDRASVKGLIVKG